METFVGDIVRITIETGVTLTGLTIGIKFVRPDGTVGYWDATIDGTDNSKMYYDTDLNDLDIPGYWRLQAFIESAGVRSHGKVVELKVFSTLTDRETVTTLAPTTPAP
jgi:hypothetical protein